jgi:hypothetical protein
MKALTFLLTTFAAASLAFAADDETGFRPLFNGQDLSGWIVRKPDAHNAWTVKDGALTNQLEAGEHGVDLITDTKYWNFVVRYEYQVPDGSNSGFYLRGRHEIQVLGDFTKGATSKTGNGAIYNHTAPSQFVSKPGDQWQTVEATVIGNKITVVLNGVKIHDNVEVNTATGSELDKNLTEAGAFFLQGDHGAVSFRNLRVKELPKE